jgi:hypothetical protein
MKKVCVILLMCVMGAVVQADIVSAPMLAGDFNGWDAAANPMNDLGGGLWDYTITGVGAGTYQQFKVTDDTWGSTAPAANSWYSADGAGEVTITFNTNVVSDGWLPEQFRVGVSTEPGAWSLVGDFNSWNNADPAQAMTDLTGGIYAITQIMAAGNWNLKPVATASWDGIGTDGRSIDAWNYNLVLASPTEVTVSVDAFAGTMKVDVVPEPATMALLGLGAMLIRRKK